MSEVTRQWQTARIVTAVDTLLTDYKPTDVVAAVRDKMISVYRHHAIALRAFGTDAANEAADLRISGWMDPGWNKGAGLGPGQILWDGAVTLGNFAAGWADVPVNDGKWPAGTYFEADTWASTTTTEGLAPFILAAADKSSIMILPTLGYTNLLFEFHDTVAFTVASIGLIWRPVSFDLHMGHNLAADS